MNNSPRDQQIRQWAMFLHFSLLASIVVPYAGLIVPVIIWQIKKDDLPEINPHGKIVVNWIISIVIYGAACFSLGLILSFLISLFFIGNGAFNPLAFSGVGISGIIFLIIGIFGILNVVFPIIGGIKANNGKVWRYPLSLRIIK